MQTNAFHVPRRLTTEGTLHMPPRSIVTANADLFQFVSSPSSSSLDSDSVHLSLQSSFGPTISQLMYTYNTNPPTDELARAQSELAQVKDIMVQNVEQILSRGERIELLVDKTDTMASQATAFRRGARTVRRQMWWKNKRVVALGVLVALVRLTDLFANCEAALTHGIYIGHSVSHRGTVLRRRASLLRLTVFLLTPSIITLSPFYSWSRPTLHVSSIDQACTTFRLLQCSSLCSHHYGIPHYQNRVQLNLMYTVSIEILSCL